MAYPGWLSYYGTEIVNEARARSYIQWALPTLKLPDYCTDCDDLGTFLGDGPYGTPITDEAPWWDPNNEDTGRFLGVLPLSVEGLTDSTRTATVRNSSGDGGAVLGKRKQAREVRVTALLVGQDEAALAAGEVWLRHALDGECDDECEGGSLCFFTACPPVDPAVGPYVKEVIQYTDMKLAQGGEWVAGKFTPLTETDSLITPILTKPLPCDEVRWTFVLQGDPGTSVVISTHGETGMTSTMTVILDGSNQSFTIADTGESEEFTYAAIRVTNMPLKQDILEADIYSDGSGGTTFSHAVVHDPQGGTTFDAATLTPVTVVSTYAQDEWNLSPNPRLSSDATGWTDYGDKGPFERYYDSNLDEYTGRVVSTIAGESGVQQTWDTGTDLTGKRVAVVAKVRSSQAQLKVGVQWLNSSGGAISTDFSALQGVTANEWTDLGHVTAIAPDTATQIRVIVAGDAANPVGTDIRVGMLRADYSSTGLTYYFDGSFTDTPDFDFSWTGQVNNSPSKMTVLRNDVEVQETVIEYRGLADVDACVRPYQRQLRRVHALEGPLTVQEYAPTSGAMRKVEFTLVAEAPDVYGFEEAVARYSGSLVTTTMVGSQVIRMSEPMPLCQLPKPSRVVLDPDCSVTPPPPRRTAPIPDCAPTGDYDDARAIFIPASAVPAWASAVPIMRISTGTHAIKQLRVRFVPRPLPQQKPEDLDPCTTCGQFVINYIPPHSTFVLNGMEERATIERSGGRSSIANHLLSGLTESDLFEWPSLSCGIGYYAMFDSGIYEPTKVELHIATKE